MRQKDDGLYRVCNMHENSKSIEVTNIKSPKFASLLPVFATVIFNSRTKLQRMTQVLWVNYTPWGGRCQECVERVLVSLELH